MAERDLPMACCLEHNRFCVELEYKMPPRKKPEPGPRAKIKMGEKDDLKPSSRANEKDGERSIGRPRTSVNDLDPNWKQIMMDAAQDGDGPTGYMVKLGIGVHALETLLQDSEDFRNTYEACLLLCRYWWETTGKRMANGAQGSAAVWAMNMTNRFTWKSNRNEVVGDPNAPLQHNVKKQELTKDEIVAELEARGLPTSIFKS